ncbi:MAG: BamA/TamA family outer membrane protein, partial [Gammaproteobacteria bacterium]|nr:BamA/TamA family outer membrane protein [Gammaproteobacteria bacterium]
AGYAFGEDMPITTNEFRESIGVALLWLTPVGAMRFSLADPLDPRPEDKIQTFQFTLGSAF